MKKVSTMVDIHDIRENPYYILDGRDVVKVDLMTWAKWFENFQERMIAQDTIGPFFVSTMFLGIDHRFCGNGPPIVFETMVFDIRDKHQEYGQARYCTIEQAEAGHQRYLDQARASVEQNNGQWIGEPSLKGIFEEEEESEEETSI